MTTKHLGDAFERLESRDIITHQQRCVKVRNRHASCSRCADACTSHCISLENNRLVIDETKCIGCGTCCTVCPTCALEATNPKDATLFEKARAALRATGGTVAFATEATLARLAGAYDPAAAVAVANLGRVEETLLVKLAAQGAREVALVLPAQPTEADEEGARTARLVCETANRVFSAWNCTTKARVVDEAAWSAPLSNDEKERAQFAIPSAKPIPHEPRAQAQPAPADAPPIYKTMKVMKDGTLPHFNPDRREQLVSTLFELGEPQEIMLETRLWGHVRIDAQRCTACRNCATFCPTGALSKYAHADGATGIEHSPSDCVKCMCCQDVCQAGAITVEDAVFAPHILDGTVERHPMTPERVRSSAHSIYEKLRERMGTKYIWER